MTDYTKQLAFIASCESPRKLKALMADARASEVEVLATAAFRRLIALEPAEDPTSMEHDFFRSIDAFELVLTEERGKTTRLSPIRQKVARVGVAQTLLDWVLHAEESAEYRMLLERGLPELTGEAVIIRHPDRFGAGTVKAARDRLAGSGVNMRDLPAR